MKLCHVPFLLSEKISFYHNELNDSFAMTPNPLNHDELDERGRRIYNFLFQITLTPNPLNQDELDERGRRIYNFLFRNGEPMSVSRFWDHKGVINDINKNQMDLRSLKVEIDQSIALFDMERRRQRKLALPSLRLERRNHCYNVLSQRKTRRRRKLTSRTHSPGCDQPCSNASSPMKYRHRRKLVLPTHSPESPNATCFGKRHRRKQQGSIQNLFEDEERELRFRFGASYKDFVLPFGVEPTPSAKQNDKQEAPTGT